MHENTLSKVALNQTLNTTSTSTLEEFTQYLPLRNERPHAIQTNSIQTKDFIMCGCAEYLYSEKGRHSNKNLIKIGFMWKINYCRTLRYIKVQISLNYMTKALTLTTFCTIIPSDLRPLIAFFPFWLQLHTTVYIYTTYHLAFYLNQKNNTQVILLSVIWFLSSSYLPSRLQLQLPTENQKNIHTN